MITRQPTRIITDILDFIEIEDDYVKNYEEIAEDDKGQFTPTVVKDEILSFIPEKLNGTLMDIGCGDGYMLHRIDSWYKIAIDISIINLFGVDANFKVRCNAENIPLINNVVNNIICVDLFEHVKNEKALAKEIIRLLIPGGYLYLGVPFEQDLSVYEGKEYKENFKQYKYVHLRSVNDKMIFDAFNPLFLCDIHLIKDGMQFMKLKPYPIKLYIFQK